MHLVCPHCQNPIELADGASGEVLCPSCGSTIRLENDSTTAWTPPDDRRRLGKFDLIDRIGMGAFGTVYKARDPELGRWVAIKVPRAGSLAGKEDLDRFLREARSVAQLRHPSIVSVHDVGQADGVPYLVSELVEGMTLADLLTARRRTPREAAELTAAVADALQYAHERGVVHRDVKPSNVMLDGEGKPHLMDFGLAKRDAGDVTMTLDGQVLGTPAYMSPEQAAGEAHKVDGRSDVYSLGVVLYEMLTGALPFRGSTRALLYQVQHEEPAPPRSVSKVIPRDLETICLRCMRKEPAQRYATARELADDLRRFLAGEPIRARPVGRLRKAVRWVKRRREVAWMFAGAAGAVVLISVLGIVFSPDEKSPDAPAPATDQAGSPGPAVTGEQDVQALPSDLALVPPDTLVFFTLRPADLLSTPSLQRVQQRLAERAPGMEPLPGEESCGVNPQQIERITVTRSALSSWDDNLADAWVIIRTLQPYDRARVLANLGGGPQREVGKETYHVTRGAAVRFVDERVYVLRPSAALGRPAVSPTGPGRLADVLRLADAKRHVLIGLDVPAVYQALSKNPLLTWPAFAPRPDLQKLRALGKVRSAAVLLQLHTTTVPDENPDIVDFDVRLYFPDDARARDGDKAVRAGLESSRSVTHDIVESMSKHPREFAAGLKSMYPAYVGAEQTLLQFWNRWEEGLNAADVEHTGPVVRVRFSFVTDLPRFAAAIRRVHRRRQDDGNKVRSQTNLAVLARAMTSYHDKLNRLIQAARYGKDGKPLLSWRVFLLPFLDQNELFNQFKLDEAWDGPHNRQMLDKMPAVYAAPGTSPAGGMTYYQVLVGKGTLFEDPGGLALAKIPKRADNTLLIVEGGAAVPWTKPKDLEYDPARPLPKLGGVFGDGFCAVSLGGKARFLPKPIHEKTLRALISRDQSHTVDPDKVR